MTSKGTRKSAARPATRPAAKTASPTRDTADVQRADNVVTPDPDEQTYVVGHDGKRVKSEAYRDSDEFKGIVKDS